MRAVLHSDLVAAARALLAVPPQARGALCRHLLEKADWADRYVRRLRRVHPEWGNGTLADAARRVGLAAEPSFSDRTYRACFLIVLGQMASRENADI
jgi:hypothetical protein